MEQGNVKGPWAIITSFNLQYVGCIIESSTGKTDTAEALLDAEWVQLSPVFEFIRPIIPAERGLQTMPTVLPLGACLEETTLRVRCTGLTLFSELGEGDRKTYESLIQAAEMHASESRVRRAGLATPGDLRNLAGARGGSPRGDGRA